MKILIIDDDQMLIDVWSMVLTKEGYEVLTAGSGREGIELAKKEQPNFILLDQIMPDMKGNEVLTLIKQDPQTSQILVAMASNYSENELMQEAIQKGAIDYILKYQIDPQDLVGKIKNLTQTEVKNEN
jgi:two-component system, OmpR family, alkaline phosphatase synthesis response regulator PhoP